MSFSFSNPQPVKSGYEAYEAPASVAGESGLSTARGIRNPSPVAMTSLMSAAQSSATVLPSNTLVDPLSSPDAEFEICGWMLRATLEDLTSAERLLERLRESDLAHPTYRAIICAAKSLIAKGEVCGATAVLDYAALNSLDVGGPEHLAMLISDPIGLSADMERIEQDLDIIIDYATRRRIRGLLHDRLNDLSSKEVKEVVAALSDDVMRMQSDSEQMRTGPRHISEVMEDVVDSWCNEDKPSGVYSTGFPDLDGKLNGGLRDGQLILLGARPGMGKTGFSLGVSRNMSLDTSHRRHVLFFSLEMDDRALAERALSAESAVPTKMLKNGEIMQNEECLNAIQQVLPRFASLTEDENCLNSRLWIDSTPGLSLADIRSRSRQFASKYGSPIIVIDYLQIVGQTQRLNGGGSSAGSESHTQAIGMISQGLKSLARELNTPVLSLAQLNRSLETRTNKHPIISDLRESGSLEQDADIIIFLYRDVIYNPDTPDPNEALAIIAKQRDGELGPVSLHFNAPLVRFENRFQPSASSNMDY